MLFEHVLFEHVLFEHEFFDHFFRLYQKDKSSESKVKLSQASNHCKRVFDAAKFEYVNKTKEFITSQKLGSQDFWQIANGVFFLNGVNLLFLLYSWPESVVLCI